MSVRPGRFLLPVPLLVAVALVTAAATVAGLRLAEPEAPTVQAAEAVFGRVEERVSFRERPVIVSASWSRSTVAVAPAWSGTVTALRPGSSDVVRSGDVVLAVDGVDRLAMATARPFYRPLPIDSTGSDVSLLQGALVDLGLLVAGAAEPGRVDWVTGEAIRGLAARIGVPVVTTTFDPAWFVWIPDVEVTVSDIAAELAAPAPPAGSVLLSGPLTAEPKIVDDKGVPVDPGPGTWALALASGATVPLLPQAPFVDSDVLLPLMSADLSDGSETSTLATLKLVEPVTELVVPSSAVLGGGEEACVISERAAVAVTVVSGSAGVVVLDDSLPAGTGILLNPRSMGWGDSCALT